MKKLEDIKKTNPFIVPDNYFEELPDKITDRLKRPVTLKLNFKWAKISGVAAVLSIITFLTVLYYINNKTENLKSQFAENNIVESFVDEHTIINAIVEDTSVSIQEKTNIESRNIYDDEDEKLDYVAESLDYESLLAEL